MLRSVSTHSLLLFELAYSQSHYCVDMKQVSKERVDLILHSVTSNLLVEKSR